MHPPLHIHVSESKATNQEAACPSSRGRRLRSATDGRWKGGEQKREKEWRGRCGSCGTNGAGRMH